jgi:predicted enzyme related to lactoylglutathione lyase
MKYTRVSQKVAFPRNPFSAAARDGTGLAMDLLVNIDVPDLGRAVAFYGGAFGLSVTRRFGTSGAELSGWPVRVYLLEKPAGTIGAGTEPRRYERHWTPVHLDVVVEDVEAALAKVLAAGAAAETEINVATWGKIVMLSDPFGHGICLIEFLGRGYDEIAERVGPG